MSYPQLGAVAFNKPTPRIDLVNPTGTAWGSKPNPFGITTKPTKTFVPVTTPKVPVVQPKTPIVIKPTIDVTVPGPGPVTTVPVVNPNLPRCGMFQTFNPLSNTCVSLSPQPGDTAKPVGGGGTITVPTLKTEPEEDGALDNATSPLPLILTAGAIALGVFLFLPKGTARRR